MGFHVTDIFATKGVEYLLIISFLAVLVVFWQALSKGDVPAMVRVARAQLARSAWFPLAPNRHYHPTHTWAAKRDGDVVRVGLDSFVGKLLGQPDAIDLPALKSKIDQGALDIALRFGDKKIELASPVGGEVVEVNEEALQRLVEDPYDGGWLFGVRVPKLQDNLRSLLSGSLAAAWMADAEERLRAHMTPAVGAVLQDGGLPVDGFVRELAPKDWDALARELLSTDPELSRTENRESQS